METQQHPETLVSPHVTPSVSLVPVVTTDQQLIPEMDTNKRPQSDKDVSVNPITKKIKLFAGNIDDLSDDGSDEEIIEKKSDSQDQVRTPTATNTNDTAISNNSNNNNNNVSEVLHKDGFSVPTDSELLKDNEAHKAYNSYILDGSRLLQTSLQNQLASIPLNIPAPVHLPPHIQLLINTIPALDNVATQILRMVVQTPYQGILQYLSTADSSIPGLAYQSLLELFKYIKLVYSTEDPFLSVGHLTLGIWKEGAAAPPFLRGKEDAIHSTIRKVNLVTFLNAVLGVIDTGFFYLNESFLDVFCPDQALNPKQTVSNLSSLSAPIFDVATLSSHSNSSGLGKLLKPQSTLYLELKTQAYISGLEAQNRSRENILDDIFPEDLGDILLRRKIAILGNQKEEPTLTPAEMDFVNRCQKRKENLLQASLDEDLSEKYDWLTFLKDFLDFSKKNISYLIWGTKVVVDTSVKGSSLVGSGNATIDQETEIDSKTGSPFKFDPDSLPSDIELHHREIKYSNSSVKNLSRRLWTKAEELALKQALQEKGPQWSLISELYGAGGAISELLKNRTQVQLKDKARNWKLFFLKNQLPLPSYLQSVTGDVDSRTGQRRSKASHDSRNKSKPPKIQQKHLDAAAKEAANDKSKVEQDTKESSAEAKTADASNNEITDESNVFAQSDKREPSKKDEEPKESAKSDVDSGIEGDNKPSGETVADKDTNQELQVDEEVPDYHFILKDLLEANNSSNTDNSANVDHAQDSTDASGEHNDVDVEKLMDEVINANKPEEKKPDQKEKSVD